MHYILHILQQDGSCEKNSKNLSRAKKILQKCEFLGSYDTKTLRNWSDETNLGASVFLSFIDK